MRKTERKSQVWTSPIMSTIWLTMPPIIASTSPPEVETARSPWSSSGEQTITRLLQPFQRSPEQRRHGSCLSSTSITSAFRQKTRSRRKFLFLMLRLEDTRRYHAVLGSGVPAAVDEQRVSGDKVRCRTCQKHRSANQIGRFREPPKFDPSEQFLRARFVFTKRAAGTFRERRGRRNRVDAHSEWS